jgi:hypothetical protein
VVVNSEPREENQMKYALLICIEEKLMADMTPSEAEASYARYAKWMEEATARGVLLGGERLRPVADSTCVRVRDGEAIISDGPFAETKEQVGGFFLVDCKDLDEAVELASGIPGAAMGTIEVRPVWEM